MQNLLTKIFYFYQQVFIIVLTVKRLVGIL